MVQGSNTSRKVVSVLRDLAAWVELHRLASMLSVFESETLRHLIDAGLSGSETQQYLLARCKSATEGRATIGQVYASILERRALVGRVEITAERLISSMTSEPELIAFGQTPPKMGNRRRHSLIGWDIMENNGSCRVCGIISIAVFFIVFFCSYIYCIVTYGFLFGLGLGWIPSYIAALLAAFLWPFIVAILLLAAAVFVVVVFLAKR